MKAPANQAGTNVWVGNLPLSYSEADFRSLMSTCGTITSLKLLKDKKSGNSEGAGMVNFATIQQATAAIAALDGQVLPNSTKPLIAKYAAAKTATPAPAMAMPMPIAVTPVRTPAPATGGTNVWVGNLPSSYGGSEVSILFSPYGSIQSCKVLKDKITGKLEGAAMVNFSTPASATAAIQALNGYPLEDGAGKTLIVRQAARDMARTPIQTVSVSLPQRTPIAPIGLPTQGIPTNLWIGNLPHTYSEADVQALFMPYGNITSTKILRDKADRPTERAAMVNYTTAQEAAVAIQTLSGATLPGSELPLIVKYAAKNFSGMHGQAQIYASLPTQVPVIPSGATDNLWVGNVPRGYTEAEIDALFSSYGNVISSVILQPKQPGKHAAAMVRFGTCAEAAAAVSALDQTMLDPASPPLIVKYATAKNQALPAGRGGPIKNPGQLTQSYHPYAYARA
jgi:RNA recognition motif-containing protein